MADVQETIQPKKKIKRDYTYALGRKREAVARVRVYPQVKDGLKWGEVAVQKAQILVNGDAIEKYFPGPMYKAVYMRPLSLTNTSENYAITVKVAGGGRSGQLGAMVQGLARALSALDPKKFRPVLKSAGLLTRDARVRERRKVGMGGKARRQKQSPKR